MKMKTKCLLSKNLDMLLRISRAMGVAPVTLGDNGLQISRPLQLCSTLFFTILNCILLAAVVVDLTVEPRWSIRVPTVSSYHIWITTLTITVLINASGVYFQSARVKCISHVLTQLIKIKKLISNKNSNSIYSKNITRTAVIFLPTALIILMLLDVYAFIEKAIDKDKELTVLMLYTSYYYQYLCVSIFECQFIAIAFEVQYVLRTITENLNDLSNTVLVKRLTTKGRLKMKNNYFPKAEANNNQINNFVDNLVTVTSISENTDEGLESILRDLSVAYGCTCDVVRELNSGFGLQLLLILMSFFMNLVVTPYYLVIIILHSFEDFFLVLLLVMWLTYHLVSMWCVVEPAYWTRVEIEKTEVLINRFLRHIKKYDPLYAELKTFSRQLASTPPSYSPLGVCTLSRNLCVTVLGTATTYLVIVLQFHA